MAVVKDEKPLWRTGLALSGPLIVLSVAALIIGVVNKSLLRSETLRGLLWGLIGLTIIALAMLVWGLRRGSRRLRRWDVRLAIAGNVILLLLMGYAALATGPANELAPDITAPQSAGGGATP